jgi:hypothetical protein
MLDSMLGGEAVGTENRTEFIRLIIRREYNRRHKLGKPRAKDWQTAMRMGRPRLKADRVKRREAPRG